MSRPKRLNLLWEGNGTYSTWIRHSVYRNVRNMTIEIRKIKNSYRRRATVAYMIKYNCHKAHTKSGNDLKLHKFKLVAQLNKQFKYRGSILTNDGRCSIRIKLTHKQEDFGLIMLITE